MSQIESSPFAVASAASSGEILEPLNLLTHSHIDRCTEYSRICDALFPTFQEAKSLAELPYLPAGIFKSLRMQSVPDAEVHRLMTSSGTKGTPSLIVLDRFTADLQAASLANTLKPWLGPRRRPMLIIDHSGVLRGATGDSARGAAILGMMRFGRDHHWLLKEDQTLDLESLTEWLDRHRAESLLVFGFTSLIYLHLATDNRLSGIDLSRATVLHGGGWKKLQERAVTNVELRELLSRNCGVSEVHDYYGMIEQLGSIWIEGHAGVLTAPPGSAAMVRDPVSLEPLPSEEVGLIQVFSTLTHSYPGHSILTEDLGSIVANKHLPESFGNFGLRVIGRVESATPRGCSDAVA